MDNVIYELKMFSSCLKCVPNIVVDGMDMTVILKGFDDNGLYQFLAQKVEVVEHEI